MKRLDYSGLIWKAKNYVNIENKETFTIVDNFNNQLEDDDDVQNVYSNAKIDKKLKWIFNLILFAIDPGVNGACCIL